MPYCTNCGTEAGERFCISCGSPVAAPPPPTPPLPRFPQVPSQPEIVLPQKIRGENIASAACYTIFVFAGLGVLLLKHYRQSKAVRFHAFQSILLAFAFLAVNRLLENLYPDWQSTFTPVSPFHAAAILYWVLLMAAALFRLRILVPLLGQLADKQA